MEGLEKELAELKSALQKDFEKKSKVDIQDALEAFEGKATGKFVDEAKKIREEFQEKSNALQEHLDNLDIRMQNNGGKDQVKSFNENLADTLAENADKLKNLRKGDSLVIEMKDVGDMSIANNFPAGAGLYQEVRPMYVPPFEQTFLGDILPGGTSSGTGIIYPERAGGEGGIDEWDGTDDVDKPQVDYDWITRNIEFTWLAGICIIERAMLDDIPWLTTFLQSQLLLDLKSRENAFILNRATTGLLTRATAYNGVFTDPVKRLVDAAYGQLPEGTFGQNRTTHFVLQPRDTVAVGLNQATGSGEFDLPQGTVGFANGVLNLSGINTVSTTSMAKNNFLAIDARSTQFVKRMQPEIRIFEDAALAKRNKLMIRIEERVALATFNPKALVKGLLVPAG